MQLWTKFGGNQNLWSEGWIMPIINPISAWFHFIFSIIVAMTFHKNKKRKSVGGGGRGSTGRGCHVGSGSGHGGRGGRVGRGGLGGRGPAALAKGRRHIPQCVPTASKTTKGEPSKEIYGVFMPFCHACYPSRGSICLNFTICSFTGRCW